IDIYYCVFFFSSRRRHTRSKRDWSSDVCSSDLIKIRSFKGRKFTMRSIMERKFTEWFLRVALSIGFLSAVADRFGWWPAEWSAWGDCSSFVKYTQILNLRIPEELIGLTAVVATGLVIILG